MNSAAFPESLARLVAVKEANPASLFVRLGGNHSAR